MRIILPDERRARFAELVTQHKSSLVQLSRIIGRSDGYFSSYLRRSVPYDLAERDRRKLARYFGVDEETLRPVPKARDKRAWR